MYQHFSDRGILKPPTLTNSLNRSISALNNTNPLVSKSVQHIDTLKGSSAFIVRKAIFFSEVAQGFRLESYEWGFR